MGEKKKKNFNAIKGQVNYAHQSTHEYNSEIYKCHMKADKGHRQIGMLVWQKLSLVTKWLDEHWICIQ